MKKYIIVAESGSDLSSHLIEKYHIHILPMHVAVNSKDYLDGEISVEELCNYYDKTGIVPTTSAVNPYQYQQAFEKIKAENPDTIIIHIGYSSQTTSSFQNARIASEHMNNVYHVDSLHVSVGQSFVITEVAEFIRQHPDVEPKELLSHIEEYAKQTKFFFVPDNLDYLRAGGRVSNAQYLGATLLKLKPLIEVEGGLLIAKGKYRGSMKVSAQRMVKQFFDKFNIDKNKIYLVYIHSIDETIKVNIEKYLQKLDVKEIVWLKAGCVITSHAGPGAIGIAGIEK